MATDAFVDKIGIIKPHPDADRLVDWVTETVAKPEPYSAHFILPPEKKRYKRGWE